MCRQTMAFVRETRFCDWLGVCHPLWLGEEEGNNWVRKPWRRGGGWRTSSMDGWAEIVVRYLVVTVLRWASFYLAPGMAD
jgi:hypothetical protein